jgi:hypothetical protein
MCELQLWLLLLYMLHVACLCGQVKCHLQYYL